MTEGQTETWTERMTTMLMMMWRRRRMSQGLAAFATMMMKKMVWKAVSWMRGGVRRPGRRRARAGEGLRTG